MANFQDETSASISVQRARDISRESSQLLEGTERRSSGRHDSKSGLRNNVSEKERVLSVAAGSMLALLGLRRRDLTGLVIAGTGGAMLLRGITGHCAVYQMMVELMGQATAGVLGYSHLTGGYAGGQAEYLRVPLADVNLQRMPEDFDDHQLVFLSDIYPTGYMAVWNCNIQPDDTVAIWGCGPVGQFTIRSAVLLGAGQVIAIDDGAKVPERLQMARDGGAITIDMHDEYVYDRLLELTGGIGPDICIDAVGMEAHGSTALESLYDKVKTNLYLETERPHALRQAILCCRKGGTLSIPGVYGGVADKIPLGAIMNKGLTIKTGQTHVHRFVPELLEFIRNRKIDPSFVVTHRLPLSQAPHGYDIFRAKQDGCIKVVLDPAA